MSSYIYQYIQERVKSINTENDISFTESIFSEVILTLIVHNLEHGNTIILLKNEWFDDFIKICQKYIDDTFFGININIKELMYEIIKQPKTNIYNFIQNYKKNIIHKLSSININKIDAEEKSEKLINIFRILYYFYNNSENTIYETIINSPIICVIQESNFQEIINNPKPIVVQRTQNKLYMWLYRSWYAEYRLSKNIYRIIQKNSNNFNVSIDIDGLNQQQKQAVSNALKKNFTIITGGPGTGKTFTIAKLVHYILAHDKKRLALIAPTGKAAKRMQESLSTILINTEIQLPEAMTIHRFLRDFKDDWIHKNNQSKLPFDIIILDEASMLGAELAAKLFSLIDTRTKLIILGDIHQLSAVDSGAVLSDLCTLPAVLDFHTQLTQSRRFDEFSGIGKLAYLANNHVVKSWEEIARTIQSYDDLYFMDINQYKTDFIYNHLIIKFTKFFIECQSVYRKEINSENLSSIFTTLNQFKILTAGHHGKFGDIKINEEISRAHILWQNNQVYKKQAWYHGKVIMVTKNIYDLDLYNGDTGICLLNKNGLYIYFENRLEPIAPALFSDSVITTAYAITIHKSQGSEFESVAICFDESNEMLLGRELLYTAITRAKKHVQLYSNPTAITYAANTPTLRQTGLSFIFSQINNQQKN